MINKVADTQDGIAKLILLSRDAKGDYARHVCGWAAAEIARLQGIVDGVIGALSQHPLGMSRTGEKTVVDVAKYYVLALEESDAVIDKLPKTADGVVLFAGEIVYALFRDGIFKGEIVGGGYRKNRVGVRFEQEIQLTDDIAVHETDPLTKCLYSTREAAEAAREQHDLPRD